MVAAALSKSLAQAGIIHLNSNENSPGNLALKLTAYFVVVFGLLVATVQLRPDLIQYLPFGGIDALALNDMSDMQEILTQRPSGGDSASRFTLSDEDQSKRVLRIALFLVAHLSGSLLVMVPITWTYKAIKYDAGFNKHFVRSLIILPICATTTVLLIQDSLALAFGLAALVAAVRFRVALEEAMDGIFIFAAVCAGLAAGIGYVGIALVMSVFFCFVNWLLWISDYGRNPMDEAKRKRKRAKLQDSGD